MEQGPAPTEPLGEVVPLRVTTQPPPPVEQLVEQGFRIAIGMTALATEVVAEAVARTLGRPIAPGDLATDEPARPASGLPLVAGAAIGVALEGARWGARAATTAYRSAELFVALLTSPGFVREPLREAGTRLGALDARWRERRTKGEEAAASFLRLLIPQAIDATLDQLDLNELVERRIELDRVVEGLDLDHVVARLDVDAIANRLDVDRILERVDLRGVAERIPVDEIVARLDLDAIVARVDLDRAVGRVDVQAIAESVDLEAIVRGLDLTAIARQVIEELDLTRIIQDAVGSMTNETVGGIRVQSMNADRAISRLRERLLGRSGEPPQVPGGTESPNADHPST